MNKKIVSVGILLCFLFLIIPTEKGFAYETTEIDVSNNEIADISLLALVVAKGTGNVTTIGGSFLFRFSGLLHLFINSCETV